MAIEVQLVAQSEKLAPENLHNIRPYLLYHQWRTEEALQNSALVMNTYNTGTGKTRASLLHLFHLPEDGRSHVLFIAPTNELLHQHAVDIQAFVDEHQLPFLVLEINADKLRKLADPDVVNRQGERLTRLLRNPREYAEQLGLDLASSQRPSLVLVINPDLFYYAFYWQFAPADQRNLFQAMVTTFRYIVIDEFHYYNSKQLANFLLYLVLSREFGYFTDNQRRLCLLSATPDHKLRTYLDRILGSDGWTLIAPNNESSESTGYPTVPVLAPLALTIQAGAVDTFAQTEAQVIKDWLAEGNDGAMISGALWRVNNAFSILRYAVGDERIGRITGAQPVKQRRIDQFKPLILATPTVDIGYNFLKYTKSRQNLDFVVFDARFQDELIQRMGRAGRVLGKQEVGTPARAIALLDQDVVAAFAPLNGSTMTRTEFTSFLDKQAPIPHKDDFSAYLSAGGMLENAYPIWRVRDMFARSEESVLERMFDAMKDVFAPASSWSYQGIGRCWSRARSIERYLDSADEVKAKDTADLMAEFLGWSMSQKVQVEDVEDNMPRLLREQRLHDGFRTWCEMQHAVTRARFSFRDSFSGPSAYIYDPKHHLSSADVTEYDVFHVAENYDSMILEPDTFREKTGILPAEQSICVQITARHEQRQRIRLEWRAAQHIP